MGSANSHYPVAPEEEWIFHSMVSDNIARSSSSLKLLLHGQDDATSILHVWLTDLLRRRTGTMTGSACFVAASGSTLPIECCQIITNMFGFTARMYSIDMNNYSQPHNLHRLLIELQKSQGTAVVMFSNVNHAHKKALSVIRYVIRKRKIDFKEFSRVSKFSNPTKMAKISEIPTLEFLRVMFVAVHNAPPVLIHQGSNRMLNQAKKSLANLHSDKFVNLFDAFVPLKDTIIGGKLQVTRERERRKERDRRLEKPILGDLN